MSDSTTSERRAAFCRSDDLAIGLAAACGGGPTEEARPAPPAAESPVAVIEKWRAKHEADYRRDWVTIAGLHPLKPGINTAGSAKTNDIVLPASAPAALGRFVRQDQAIRFEPAPGAPVTLNDQPVTKPIDVRDDRGPKADELLVGDVRLVVHVSGDTRSLRVRRSERPARRRDSSASPGSRSTCSIASSDASSRTRSRSKSRC